MQLLPHPTRFGHFTLPKLGSCTIFTSIHSLCYCLQHTAPALPSRGRLISEASNHLQPPVRKRGETPPPDPLVFHLISPMSLHQALENFASPLLAGGTDRTRDSVLQVAPHKKHTCQARAHCNVLFIKNICLLGRNTGRPTSVMIGTFSYAMEYVGLSSMGLEDKVTGY